MIARILCAALGHAWSGTWIGWPPERARRKCRRCELWEWRS